MLLKSFLTADAAEIVESAETAIESAAAEAAAGGFSFHPGMFIENLKYMGLGMLCIFIVIAVIIGVVMALEKLTSAKKSEDAE